MPSLTAAPGQARKRVSGGVGEPAARGGGGGALNRLCLQLLGAVVDSFEFSREDPAANEALAQVLDVFGSCTLLSLFNDWCPASGGAAGGDGEERVASERPARAADGSLAWTLTLPHERLLSSVVVVCDQRALVSAYEIDVGGEGDQDEPRPVARVRGRAAEKRVHLDRGRVQRVRVRLTPSDADTASMLTSGFEPEVVRIDAFVAATATAAAPLAETLSAVQGWLARAARAAAGDAALQARVLDALLTLSESSGSLVAALRLVDALLDCPGPIEDALAVHASSFLGALNVAVRERGRRRNKRHSSSSELAKAVRAALLDDSARSPPSGGPVAALRASQKKQKRQSIASIPMSRSPAAASARRAVSGRPPLPGEPRSPRSPMSQPMSPRSPLPPPARRSASMDSSSASPASPASSADPPPPAGLPPPPASSSSSRRSSSSSSSSEGLPASSSDDRVSVFQRSREEVAHQLLHALADMAGRELCDHRRFTPEMEEPFCVQVSREAFELSAELLARLRRQLGNAACSASLLALLQVVKLNLRRLTQCKAARLAAMRLNGTSLDSPLGRLHSELELLVTMGASAEPASAMYAISLQAAFALHTGQGALNAPAAPPPGAVLDAALEPGATLELHLRWPTRRASGHDDTRYERLVLLLLLECTKNDWRHRLVGQFDALLHLVLELPAGVDFFGGPLKRALAEAGFDALPAGLAAPSQDLSVVVARHRRWDRLRWMSEDPAVAWVRVYAPDVACFDDVVNEVEPFVATRSTLITQRERERRRADSETALESKNDISMWLQVKRGKMGRGL